MLLALCRSFTVLLMRRRLVGAHCVRLFAAVGVCFLCAQIAPLHVQVRDEELRPYLNPDVPVIAFDFLISP